MSNHWYALQIRSRHEQAVALALANKELETYLPLYRSSRQWADRKKQVDLPLIPGYVFCRFDAEKRLPVLTTNGVIKIVGVGKMPAPVEEREIESLQRLERTELPREPHPFPTEGEEVIVSAGPLKGFSGLFVKVNRSGKLLLSVKLLYRAVSVQVDPDCVVPLADCQRAPGQIITESQSAPIRGGVRC